MGTLARHIRLNSIKRSVDVFIYRKTCKIAVNLDNRILTNPKNHKVIKDHPGIIKSKHTSLPQNIAIALKNLNGDYPLKSVLADSRRLNNYIKTRQLPAEFVHERQSLEGLNINCNQSQKVSYVSETHGENCNKQNQALRPQRINHWKPMVYDSYRALLYAVGRSSQEYAILMKTLTEIEKRDPSFKPKSYLDFGSGVGTGMWAASTLWKDTIFEYLNIDISKEMNDLSNLILREGNEEKASTLQHVYYRQFLPRIATKYDLIVSSFSLFELPSSIKRKEVLLSLWQKCSGYLIIIEEGTLKGSEIINEARELLLKQAGNLEGSIIAPCSHRKTCPMLALKRLPCNFEVSYTPLNLQKPITEKRSARYSYITFKKGDNLDDYSSEWPRIVRPTLIRSRHVISRLCASNGNLQEIIFTRSKHGSQAYRCAKISRWGDRLPIEFGEKLK